MKRTLTVAALVFAALTLLGIGALGATFVVNTDDDGVDVNPGDGRCASDFENSDGNTACTIRAAIQEANARGGEDTIELPAITMQLFLDGRDENSAATGDLDITDSLVIRGTTNADDENSTVDARSIDRVFEIHGVRVRFEGFTITAGTVIGVPGGGAIFNNGGELTLSDMNVNGNSGSVRAGGIENAGSLNIADSAISSNSNGGLYNMENGEATIEDSEFVSNSRGSGAGIHNRGILEISGTTFNANNATTNPGGAIFNDNRLTVNTSIFMVNNAGTGGGIFNASGGVATVLDSTFQQNLLFGVGGSGGGVVNSVDATMMIRGTTMRDNISDEAGGIHNSGDLTLVNSTISTNFVRFAGGAAINEESGTMTIKDSTITANSAGMTAGGIENRGGNVSVQNSIIGGNNSQGTSPDCSGSFTSQGSNLIGIDEGCEGFGEDDLVGTSNSPIDPGLEPLADNGGPTQTHAVSSSSPARDAGGNCESMDQRGVSRPRGSSCDIGAYEA